MPLTSRPEPGANATMRSASSVVAALGIGISIAALLTGCSAPRLPAGFPSSVPVLPGPVLAANHDVYEWYVWIGATHPVAAYSRARTGLLQAGFDETHDDQSAGGSDGQFCDPTWCVTITGFTDPDHGPSVKYEVSQTSGLAPPKPLPTTD